MATLSKQDFAVLFNKISDLPDLDGLVLKSLLDRTAISGAELAADLSILPSSIWGSINRLATLDLVDLEPQKGRHQTGTIRLNRYGVEAASMLRSLEKLERERAIS